MINVSIIVPVYNAENAVRRCVDSILSQEYQDFEVILVDDGSQDSTPQILDEYARKDSRVKVIHQKNAGVSVARNKALDIASGQYVQFLDADDWIPDNSTKMLVREAEEKNVDLVIADFYRVVGKNVARKGSIETNEILTLQQFAELMMESPSDFYYGVLWNKLYRNDIIQQYHVRMDEDLSWCEDFIFNLEYLLHVKTVTALQVPVYYYVKTEGSLVSKSRSLVKVINMKTNVFAYYDDFYKNVLDEKQYRKDRLSIAGFLIDAASDDAALPMMPGTMKLGKENVQVHVDADVQNAVLASYYLNKGYEKNLGVVALKYDIDLKDARVLAAVKQIGETDSLTQISDLAGIGEVSITSMLPKLVMKGLLSVSYTSGQVTIKMGRNADGISQDLDTAMNDLKEVMTKNMDPSLRESVKKGILLGAENLKKYVKTNGNESN